MRNLTIGLFASLAVLAMPVSASAATQCKDAKGKFTKCPPAAAAPKTVAKKEAAAAKTEAKAASKMASAAKKEAAAASKAAAPSGKMAGRCRNAKGQFAKCGTPGAKPA